MKTCLAFDQSSDKTGIALIIESQPTVCRVKWAVSIETPDSNALLDNFPWMKMTGFNPDIIAHEEGFVSNTIRHAGLVIATTGGWVEMLRSVYFRYARLHHAMATTWRQAVWGDGKMPREVAKDYSIQFAVAHGITDPDDHMGDAIGIGMWALGEDRKIKTNGGTI